MQRSLLLALLVGLGAAGCAAPVATGGAGCARFEPGASVVVATPRYPRVLMQNGRQGRAVAEAWVTTDGLPDSVRVAGGSEPEFEAAALNAAQRTTFRAARCDGAPVGTWIEVPFRFRIGAPG